MYTHSNPLQFIWTPSTPTVSQGCNLITLLLSLNFIEHMFALELNRDITQYICVLAPL